MKILRFLRSFWKKQEQTFEQRTQKKQYVKRQESYMDMFCLIDEVTEVIVQNIDVMLWIVKKRG